MVVACEALFKQWIEVDEKEVDGITIDSFRTMQPLQQIEFLSQLWQVTVFCVDCIALPV